MKNLKFYNGVTSLTGFYIDKIYKPEVILPEHIDLDKNYLFAGNHVHWLDPALVVYALDKLPIHFMAKKELFENYLLRYIVENLGAFPIDRGNNDIKAVKTAIKLLKDGENIGIFPEGTRNKTLWEFKKGIPKIANIAKKEIIPFGISGEYKYNGNLTIKFGQPIDFKDIDKNKQDEYLKEKIKELI